MTMSTGDPRRSAPKKSTTPESGAGTDAEVTEGPVGGVLPVKKAVPRANGKSGSGTAAARTGSSRTAGAAPTRTAPAKAAGTSTKPPPAKSSRSTVTETIESSPSVFSRKSATKATSGARGPASLGGGKGPGGGKGLGGGKAGGRRPAAPVKVAERRNWGPILLFAATGLVALLIIGWGAWPLLRDSNKGSWQEQAAAIPGIKNFVDPASPDYNAASTQRTHVPGDLSYEVTPPVGGNHNGYWQNCMGDIYPAQIADEHAVHSLEHGAVWVTYNPDLPQDQIDKLANRVRDVPYTLMSPYPGLDSKISLQSWGYQLKVDDANDPHIDDFINALRLNNSQEEGASCSGGVTDTGATPLDLAGGEM